MATNTILPKKLTDFTIEQTLSLIDEVGEELAAKMLAKTRTILEAAQEKDFAVSEALDIVYVMQSLTLQHERLQSYRRNHLYNKQ